MFRVLIIVSIVFVFSFCKKKEKELRACFSADRTTIHERDSVLFTDCSVAQQTHLVFYESSLGEPPAGLLKYSFNQQRQLYMTFPMKGDWKVMIYASNPDEKGSPEERKELLIKVIS